MGRKTESPPSRFWVRLTEAFETQGLPTTQLGVAKLLEMSHTSVRRWYHGEGGPRELETYKKLAVRGKVNLDWLVTGRKPKYPISEDPLLAKIMEACIELDRPGREAILRAARMAKVEKGRNS